MELDYVYLCEFGGTETRLLRQREIDERKEDLDFSNMYVHTHLSLHT